MAVAAVSPYVIFDMPMQQKQQQRQEQQRCLQQPEHQKLPGADGSTIGSQPLCRSQVRAQMQQMQQQPGQQKLFGAGDLTTGAQQLQQALLQEKMQQLQQSQTIALWQPAHAPTLWPHGNEAHAPAIPQSLAEATRAAAAQPRQLGAPEAFDVSARLRRSSEEVAALASELLATPLGRNLVRTQVVPPSPGLGAAPALAGKAQQHTGAPAARPASGRAFAGAPQRRSAQWPTAVDDGQPRGPAVDAGAWNDQQANGAGLAATELAECHTAGAWSAGKAEKTTLMIRGLPQDSTQEEMLKLWPTAVWKYDLLFLPRNIGGKCSFGYAFVNFVSEAHARAFKAAWHRVALPSMSQDRAISITFADVQGFDANMARLSSKRVNRSKARFFRPAVFNHDDAAGVPPEAL
mmetsp:Transcript_93172/g.268143  ORF Transcript_93172/g.268143 Transcript_93172/m.268143 type:complete len:405 (-) Transcript_93172:222-1436(-)